MKLGILSAVFAMALALPAFAMESSTLENGAAAGWSLNIHFGPGGHGDHDGRGWGPGRGPGHGPGWGPGHGPGWGPGHGPGWGPGPGPRPVQCWAQDWRGQTFEARGWDWRRTQDEAIRECWNYSYEPRSCRAAGCRR